jgi:hypothetical protein
MKIPFKTRLTFMRPPHVTPHNPKYHKWVRAEWVRESQRNKSYMVYTYVQTPRHKWKNGKPEPQRKIPLYLYLPEERRWYGNKKLLHITCYVPRYLPNPPPDPAYWTKLQLTLLRCLPRMRGGRNAYTHEPEQGCRIRMKQPAVRGKPNVLIRYWKTPKKLMAMTNRFLPRDWSAKLDNRPKKRKIPASLDKRYLAK